MIKHDLYSNEQKVDFKPLTYIEVEQNKPLIIKLSDKFTFKTYLQIADNFINFNASKNQILDTLEKLNNIKDNTELVAITKINCYKSLITLLYEISKNYYVKRKHKREYLLYLMNLFMNDVTYMINVFQQVLDYNVELKKKLEKLQNTQIFKNAISMTAGGQRLEDLVETDPSTGEKRLRH